MSRLSAPRCASHRRRLVLRALGAAAPSAEAEDGLRRHLLSCSVCRTYEAALTAPAGQLDALYAPVRPPARVWRRIRRALRPGLAARTRWGAAAAAAALVAALAWGSASALAGAMMHADETTLMAAVWGARPAVSAWQAQGIRTSAWPASVHGAGLVCRLKDGRWLVSVLVHDVPTGARLREKVLTATGAHTRLLRPVGRTVLDVAAVPAGAGAVRVIQLWEGRGRDAFEILNWHVAVATAPTGGAGTDTGAAANSWQG